MKILIVLALAALACAEPESAPKSEADPYWYGSRLGYSRYGWGGWGGYGLGYGYRYKRDAESAPNAEAKADPYFYSSLGYTGIPYASYGAYSGVINPYVSSLGYTYVKREAGAEPEAKSEADPYWAYRGWGGLGYRHYGLGGVGYGLGYGYRYKRDAESAPKPEAKADPYFYTSLGYTGIPYASYGAYSGVINPYVSSLGFTYVKREAGAEPEAEADPQYIYNYNRAPFYSSYYRNPYFIY